VTDHDVFVCGLEDMNEMVIGLKSNGLREEVQNELK
jgi:hypothetical protein